MKRRALAPLALALAACAVHGSDENTATVASAATPAITEVTSFGDNPGAIKMYEHVPAKLAASPGLVVVLHGCTQGAADASGAYGFDAVADASGFVVVYPEQSTANNQTRCFNWGGVYGNMATLERGKGENGSIKAMVDRAIATHGVDPKKVYVAGFSAGAAEALVVAAAWPDVFAGVAAVAGVPYKCPTSFSDVFTCQNPGKTKSAAEWGDLAKSGYNGFAGPWPRATIWQGTADTIVGTQNRAEIVKQWSSVLGVDAAKPTVSDKVDGQDHTAWKDASGAIVLESFAIAGMGHGFPVAPSAGCGTAGQYALDEGICAARHISAFFGLTPVASGDGGASSSGTPGGDGAASSSGASSSSSSAGGGGNKAAPEGASDDPQAGDYGSTCAVGAPGALAGWASSASIALVVALGLVVARGRRGARGGAR